LRVPKIAKGTPASDFGSGFRNFCGTKKRFIGWPEVERGTGVRHAEFTLNELVVLSLLHEREMYGLEIVRAAAARTSPSQASVGTVYPLLKDLVREGWLACRRTGGSPRTYYRLTDQGKAQLPLIAAQWEQVHDSVSALLNFMPMAAAANPPAAPEL